MTTREALVAAEEYAASSRQLPPDVDLTIARAS